MRLRNGRRWLPTGLRHEGERVAKGPHDHVSEVQDEHQGREALLWRPPTFQYWYLASLIALTCVLMAIIGWLLVLSNMRQGIIFARNINELPLRKSFNYLYLPTIIVVLYGFLWTWIDLDIRRLEPYFQLSKDCGATGDQSITLAYPLQFILTIPFSAFRRGQWVVLVGSLAILLVLWGLTPIQSGIFAVRTINVHDLLHSAHSTTYTPLSQQGNTSSVYAQSVYNIAWLNETLPPFMTRDCALSPFGPAESKDVDGDNITFSGLTNAYSIDLSCERATLWNNSGSYYYNSTRGCSIQAPTFRPLGGNDTSRPFDTLYAGYQNRDGFAQYYLEGYCSESFFNLFFVRWSKVTQAYVQKPMNTGSMRPAQALNDNSLFCQASYYQQQVNATVRLPSNAVLEVQPVGAKSSLPADFFNVSTFEWAMNSGQEQVATRGEWPTTSFPDQKSQLLDMHLNLDWVPLMAPFAIATNRRPAEDYLDSEVLRISYQSAYRLLFSRQVVDILKSELDYSTRSSGTRAYVTQAVVVVPGFAFAAIAVLGVVLGLATWLLGTVPRRPNRLQYDPATLGSLMRLTCLATETIATLSPHDQSQEESLKQAIAVQRFALHDIMTDQSRTQVTLQQVSCDSSTITDNAPSPPIEPIAGIKGLRPLEMKGYIGAVFFVLQLTAITTFAVLFVKFRSSGGLALPSQSTFIRQLLENYIPIALATLIEPFWLILNRFIGLLQPFEELRKGNCIARKSIDLDYSSLPPQFLFIRAFRARHFMMMALCFMVLSANMLSVALNGIMYEGTEMVARYENLSVPYSPQLLPLRGTGPPFNDALEANSDGSGTVEAFYRAMSNVTADTPLPAWASDTVAFWPVDLPGLGPGSQIQLDTAALTTKLECKPLVKGQYVLEFNQDASAVQFEVSIRYDDDNLVNCSNFKPWTRTFAGSGLNSVSNPAPGRQALEMSALLSTRSIYQTQADAGRNVTEFSVDHDLFCRQHIVTGWLRADWDTTNSTLNSNGNFDLRAKSLESTFLLCKPTVFKGEAQAIFDSDGRVVRPISLDLRPNDDHAQGHKTNQSSFANFIAQINQFLVDGDATWHNDSLPSDYNNYLIQRSLNRTTIAFLDPYSPPPSAEAAAEQYASVYSRLFSILVSTNHPHLFQPATPGSAVRVVVFTPETRILFSTPAFIVVQAILSLYVLTTIAFYLRRPWKILPRLPSTIASQIAFFAGSQSLREMLHRQGDIHEGVDGWKWGYGKYIAVDGKVRIGIDREPFVSKITRRDRSTHWDEPPPYAECHGQV